MIVGSILMLAIPVQPVKFNVVHDVGKAGIVVSLVNPDKFTDVSLVEADKSKVVKLAGNPVKDVIFGGVFNSTSEYGKAGNLVSLVNPDKFTDASSVERDKSKVVKPEGNPGKDVIFRGVFNSTSETGKVGNVVNTTEFFRFSLVSLVGKSGNDVIFGGVDNSSSETGKVGNVVNSVDSLRSRYVSLLGKSGNDVIFGGVFNSSSETGKVGNVVNSVDVPRYSFVSLAGNPGNDVIFGGVSNSTSETGKVGSVVNSLELSRYSLVSLVEAVKFKEAKFGEPAKYNNFEPPVNDDGPVVPYKLIFSMLGGVHVGTAPNSIVRVVKEVG